MTDDYIYGRIRYGNEEGGTRDMELNIDVEIEGTFTLKSLCSDNVDPVDMFLQPTLCEIVITKPIKTKVSIEGHDASDAYNNAHHAISQMVKKHLMNLTK